jgi:RimJ/RimL family protein N-acetyltransferase
MISLVNLGHLDPNRPEDLVPAAELTYRLLKERPAEANISHTTMPTFEQHQAYLLSNPYQAWYAIVDEDAQTGQFVGAILLTKRNEIGIGILKEHRRKGYARAAVSLIMRMHDPAPAIPGERRGSFLANINPDNHASIWLFTSLGARLIQYTYEL